MRSIVTILLIASLAGCAASEPEPVADVAAPTMRAEERPVEAPRVRELEAPVEQEAQLLRLNLSNEVVFGGTCDGTCQMATFVVEAPQELARGLWVDARVYWDGTQSAGFQVWLEQAGAAVGEARRGYDAARTLVWEPTGEYRIVVQGDGDFTGNVRLRHADVPALPGGDLLPNIVTLTPIELYIGGCLPEEQAEEGASRCLRLGNAVGNVGDGPLEVHLDYVQGALAAAAMGQFTQRIYQEGGFRDRPASGAALHLSHGHFHYAGLAHFALFEHDAQSGLRGAEVAVGVKRGFCFLDWGDMKNDEAPSAGHQRAEQDCLIPDLVDGWSMGVSRGMYDYYWPQLADQYIDIPGVPDGIYELVSVADGADSLAEADETDNAASLLVEIKGDDVAVLEVRSFYDNPEQA